MIIIKLLYCRKIVLKLFIKLQYLISIMIDIQALQPLGLLRI